MEETISSPPTTSNHDNNARITVNPPKLREGELSASRNHDFAGSQVPDGTILPPASVSKRTSVIEKGVTAQPQNFAVASRTTVHSNKRKGMEKNRVPFVISFSDDDSGSESEEYERGTAMESDSRRVSTSTVNLQSQMVLPTAKTYTKTPKNLSTSRTFVPSVNRVNGTQFKNSGNTFVGVKTQPKKPVPPNMMKFGQNVHINSNKLQDLRQLIAIRENELKSKAGKLDKDVATSSKKNSTNMNMKSVAVRTKSLPDRAPVELKEQEKKRLKVNEPPRNAVVSVGQHDRPSLESELKEQEMKRLKVNEPPRNAVVSVNQHDRPSSESTVVAGVAIAGGQQDRPPSESTVAAGVAISAGQQDRTPSESTVAAGVAISAGQQDRTPSESTVAAGVAISAGQQDKTPSESTVAAGVAISAGQQDKTPSESTVAAGVAISAGQQDRTPSESTVAAGVAISAGQQDRTTVAAGVITSFGQHGILAGQHGSSSLEVQNHDIPSMNLPSGSSKIRNSMQHNMVTNLGEFSGQLVARTDKAAPPRQGAVTNPSFWNHFGVTAGEMDMKSVMEIEELQDKELDEAQEHRRKCEIEERNALKAYRKAQRALAEANTRCSYLYHQRNLFSANLPSHVMEGSNMLWSNMPHQHIEPNLTSVTNMSENDLPDHQVQNEPNTSRSEPQEEEKTNDVGSSINISVEDEHEQTSAFGNKLNNDSITIETNKDSLLLEQTLRSQLFARLGVRTSSKRNESGSSMETASGEREDGEIMEDFAYIPSFETATDQTMEDNRNLSSSEQPVDHGFLLAEPILKSTFSHVKLTTSHSENTQIQTVGEEKVVNGSNSVLDLYVSEVGSYSNNLPINPFWPHCMFELRGKCNDDECPLQHVRDYSSKNIDHNNNDRGSLCLAPPTYLVCLDSLKADSHPYKYLVAQTVEQRWQKHFSATLVASSSVLADTNSDELSLHGPETRIEVHGVWNRQSSYFHGQNKEGQPDEHMDGIYQALEKALNLSREVNKQKGHRESLIILARALEEHPASALLWIVYLHIFYSNQKSIGKDDLYRYAIENNEASYELWLMFINSREKLDDRLLAYDTAISALCHHASTHNRDPELDSACILDLFLQMINCLSSSGQVNTATQKVYGLLSSTLSGPDIQKLLTIPDRRVLWVCSIYLLMYKKLPDTIIEQFECRKELFSIEWDSVCLTDDEKQQAVTLLQLASEFVDSKSTQHFALNHIRCTAVVNGFNSSIHLLKKYIQLHPSYMELVLLSIQMNRVDSGSTFAAFEEALTNWVGEREHGIQCIWNQYAGYALETGKVDLAKEIMERWYRSISEAHFSKTETLNTSFLISTLTETDLVFGLLNLSLHKQLQNDPSEARISIERAFELASAGDYHHCVKEHATLLLRNDLGFGKAHLQSFLNSLNRYLTDSRALDSPSREPLSRSFIKSIGKPKTRKSVNNLLCPISSDSSLLNLVLESCFGPSLLPSTDVIDFAETVLEIRPANYRLTLSVCKNQRDASASVSFWASMQLIDSLFQAVPVAPESVWVEAASLLKETVGFRSILESFHKRALSVFPFSLRLWRSYRGLYDDVNDRNQANAVIQMAGEKGIKL